MKVNCGKLMAFWFCMLFLALAGWNDVRAQNVVTRPIRQYGLPGTLACGAISPDGQYLLTGSGGGAMLWDLSNGGLVRSYLRDAYVVSVAFSPDGRKTLTAAYVDNSNYDAYPTRVQMWDTATGALIRTFDNLNAAPAPSGYQVVFSPDGSQILGLVGDTVDGAQSSVGLWDATTGALIRTFSGAGGPLAFSPDGSRILTGSGGDAKLWDVFSGAVVQTFSAGSLTFPSLAFSPDGGTVLTCWYNSAKLWDASTGVEIRTFSGHTMPVHSAAFSPDGSKILTAARGRRGDDHADDTAKLWDAATGALIRTFPGDGIIGYTGSITSVAFLPDGGRVLMVLRDNIKLLDATSGAVLRTFTGFTDPVTSVAFSSDGRRILTGASLTAANLWDAESGGLLHTFFKDPMFTSNQGFKPAAFSPDGSLALTAAYASVRLWDVATGALLRTFPADNLLTFDCAAFSPDGQKVLIASPGTPKLKLWDVAGTLIRTFTLPAQLQGSRISCVAFSPDGNRILSGSYATAVLWDTATGAQLRTFSGSDSTALSSLAFSPDGGMVLTGSVEQAGLWNASTGELIRTFAITEPVRSVAFSPDGGMVLIGLGSPYIGNTSDWNGTIYNRCSNRGTAQLWNASTGELIRTFSGHTAAVTSVAFSPDGQKILTGSGDGTARLSTATPKTPPTPPSGV